MCIFGTSLTALILTFNETVSHVHILPVRDNEETKYYFSLRTCIADLGKLIKSRVVFLNGTCKRIGDTYNRWSTGATEAHFFSTETEFDPQNRSSSLQKLSWTHRIRVHC